MLHDKKLRNDKMKKITPIILSGGSGTRLWPLSRSLNPKQFLSFFGDKTLFQDTILRVSSDEAFSAPIIVCNDEHRFIAAENLQKIGVKKQSIILEPVGRNTAPAIAVAAFDVIKNLGADNDLMLVMASDHIIKDASEFLKIVKEEAIIADDYFITFGIVPTEPQTGYGYIKKSDKIGETNSFLVEKFVEKPNKETAEKFLTDACYYWNSGIFMFRASKYLHELKKLKPEIYEYCQKSYEKATFDLDFIRLDKENFEKCENISIDYAVMENLAQSSKIAVAGLNVGWDDVGNFESISKNLSKDEDNNNILGDVVAVDTKNSYINSQNGLVAAIGVKNLIIVNLKDAVLIADKSSSQDVKKVYEILKKQNREECKAHTKVLRPWGSFEVLDDCKGFKVKRIVVKSGASLSLQMHHKRAEHWIVVRGKAIVTCGDTEFELKTGESTFIPLQQKHRLENKGGESLEIIEVQTGDYLGEDDIVRFSDVYGR